MAAPWKKYQADARDFFISLGFEAENDVTVQGVRTNHDVDVLVKIQHAGIDIIWIVECKFWESRVSKLHVLALREIVTDIGADRGILLSESGFQSGALSAASYTNVECTSLSELKTTASDQISMARLRDLAEQLDICGDIYWDISKEDRIKFGLRSGGITNGPSGTIIIQIVQEVIAKAIRGLYPIYIGGAARVISEDPNMKDSFNNPAEVISAVGPVLANFRARLDRALSSMGKI